MQNVTDFVNIGDEVRVKVILIDDQGRIKLSRKAAMKEEGNSDPEPVERPPVTAATSERVATAIARMAVNATAVAAVAEAVTATAAAADRGGIDRLQSGAFDQQLSAKT